MPKQKWIYNSWVDGIFILLPPFFCLLIVILFPDVFSGSGVSLFWWVALVLCIDVAHVYSTLYRTYIDAETVRNNRMLLLGVPFLAFVAGVILYSFSALAFWRIMAYLAVFHFVRQQYGFMRIYSRGEEKNSVFSVVDTICVYSLTILPVVSWHFSGGKNFHWFVDDDFPVFNSGLLVTICDFLFFSIVALFITKEVFYFTKFRSVNLPRVLLIAGTGLSWYAGIVWFNNDLTFTLFNVVSHGVPYMALVWIYGRKKMEKGMLAGKVRYVFTKAGVMIFIGIILLLAFVEEGLWDRFVWKDHESFFTIFKALPDEFASGWLSIIVPLLSLPQITHYIIDGFIWKIKDDKFGWKNVTLPSDQ